MNIQGGIMNPSPTLYMKPVLYISGHEPPESRNTTTQCAGAKSTVNARKMARYGLD